MTNWQDWVSKLGAADESEIDDVVDELAWSLLDSAPDPTSTPAAIKALNVARSDLSVRSAATALAHVASDDAVDAVECLEHAFEARRQHVFLAPALLGSLTLLGLRNVSARAGAVRFLLRLRSEDPRSLLVAGAKAIGLLCDREHDAKLRTKLLALVGSEDTGLRAEARQQSALMTLADAFLAESHAALITLLKEARAAFRAVELLEEVRPDATLFRLLLEAVLEFDDLELDRSAASSRIERLATALREMGGRVADELLQMDRSPAASQLANRCERVASSLEAAAKEVANAARWTNFDRSVVQLAKCYGDIRYQVSMMPGYEHAGRAIRGFADRVIAPRLGPVLARKVGWESFAEVIRHYEGAEGMVPEVLDGLRELQHAVVEAERAGTQNISEESVGRLRAVARKLNCTPEELVSRLQGKIGTNGGGALVTTTELISPPPGQRGRRMSLPTIGIIVALPEEFDAVRAMIMNEERYRAEGPGGGREYLLGSIPSVRKGAHQIVIAQTMDMGNTSAASRTSKMLMDFDGLNHIIMCGIAGGVPHPAEPQEHVRLGDIVVSNRKGVVQYDFGKQKGDVFEERFAPRPPSAKLLEAVNILEQDRMSGQRPWDEHLNNGLKARSLMMPEAASDVIFDENGTKVEHPAFPESRPRVFLGPIASANAVQGDFKKRDRLRDEHKVKAVEMEGYGVADATWEHETSGYLVVRGICDYCDTRTKHLQTDAWKRYAAMVAAAYVRALIEAMPGSPGVDG